MTSELGTNSRSPYNDEVGRVAKLLMETWYKVDPDSSVTKHPASYVINFADMAKTIIADWNTRAVPDVPELVRYDHNRFAMVPNPMGGYVRHDQAVAVIAAKDAVISEISNHLDCEADSDSILHTIREIEADKDIYSERAEAAEAELAQSEKQEAVAWSIIFSPHYGVNPETTFKTRERAEAYIAGCSRGKLVALYAAPVASDAELRAENEDLRGHAARIIAAFDEENDLDDPEKFNAYFDLKAALNPSEPRT